MNDPNTRFTAIDTALADLTTVAADQIRLTERVVTLLTAPGDGNELTEVMRNIERLLQEIVEKLEAAD